MTLGNLLLEYHSLIPKNQDYSLLQRAETRFEESIAIVQELGRMNKADGEVDKEFNFRQRALLLCRGRANTNLGKTYFEQSEMRRVRGDQREHFSKLAKAVRHLRNAESDARSLRAQAITNIDLDPRAEMHKFDANLLLSLACRFQGYAFWRLSKEKTCIDALKKAAGLSDRDDTSIQVGPKVDGDTTLVEAKVGLMLEHYDGACSLVHITPPLFNLALRGNTNDKWDDDLFGTLCDGYDQAAKISETLEKLKGHSVGVKDMIEQKDVLPSSEINKLKDETMTRYRERKLNGSQISLGNHSTLRLPRNDLFRNDGILSRSEPTERIVIDGTTRKQHDDLSKRNSKKMQPISDDAFDDFGLHTNDGNEATSFFDEELSPLPVQYRKWGDELFKENGMDIDAFPSCEPERPPEMIRELKELGIEE